MQKLAYKTLINQIAKNTGQAPVIARQNLEIILATIKDFIKTDFEVSILHFGKFYQKQTKPRIRKNIKTGEKYNSKSNKQLKFKQFGAIEEFLNTKSVNIPF